MVKHNQKAPLSLATTYIHNLYLITKSDHPTILYPGTYFAFVSALSGPVLVTGDAPPFASILVNVFKALLWLYFDVLIIGLSNQRLPSAVLEDKVNNPWRNIPAGRMTSEQYRRLLLVVIPLAFGVAWYLDVVLETAILVILNYMYNDMEGADEHFVIRNLFNVLGYFYFEIGALRIAYGPQAALNTTAYIWLVIIGAVMFSTISVQDLKDQKGDKLRGRKSLPLVLGDLFTRWTVVLFVLLWSMLCPFFFHAAWWTYIGTVAVGVWVAATVIQSEDAAKDKLAFKRWSVWVMTLYSLPFTKNLYVLYTHGAFDGLSAAFSNVLALQ